MSSEKTSALGLCQWQLTDPLLIEKLNEDNRKIDAGFASRAVKKLGRVITASASTQIDLDLSGIDYAPS